MVESIQSQLIVRATKMKVIVGALKKQLKMPVYYRIGNSLHHLQVLVAKRCLGKHGLENNRIDTSMFFDISLPRVKDREIQVEDSSV